MNLTHARPLASVGLAALVSLAYAAPARAQAVAPDLGTAASYAVLGTNGSPTTGTVTCTTSTINGDVGSTGGFTNTLCTVNGDEDTNLSVAGPEVTDFDDAYAALDALNPDLGCAAMPTGIVTVPPGVYCSVAGTTYGVGDIFTLDGDAGDVWVFKIGTGGTGALTGTGMQVVMGGTAEACNVYWWTAEGATMTDSAFIGTVLSGAAIETTGGSWLGRAQATTDVTVTSAAPMTFAGCSPPSPITVNKDFIPDSAATVSVDLDCTSGTVIETPLDAAEGAPAEFTVGGADLEGTTCKATETVPDGFTADETGCEIVLLGGDCTITNTLDDNTILVNKDFIPDSAATVLVDLTCTSGTVTETPLEASEATPAVFTVNGALAGATCKATETVPDGFTADETDCEIVLLGGDCTITNTLPSVLEIPTLGPGAMALLVALLAGMGLLVLRRLSG